MVNKTSMKYLIFIYSLSLLFSCNSNVKTISTITYEDENSHDHMHYLAESTNIKPIRSDSILNTLINLEIDRIDYSKLSDTNYVVNRIEKGELTSNINYEIILIKHKNYRDYNFLILTHTDSQYIDGQLFAIWNEEHQTIRKGELFNNGSILITDLVSEVELQSNFIINEQGEISKTDN